MRSVTNTTYMAKLMTNSLFATVHAMTSLAMLMSLLTKPCWLMSSNNRLTTNTTMTQKIEAIRSSNKMAGRTTAVIHTMTGELMPPVMAAR